MESSSQTDNREEGRAERLNLRFKWLAAITVVVALSRLLPHPPNFTPVAAVALFGGAYFDKKMHAVLVPLAAMLLSDLGLELMFGYGIHGLMPVIYGLFLLTIGIGFLLRRKVTGSRVLGAAVGSSLMFFLGSNLAVWWGSAVYPQTFDGLITCYVAAIPFYQNTLMGTLCYSALLFGGWTFMSQRLGLYAEPRAA